MKSRTNAFADGEQDGPGVLIEIPKGEREGGEGIQVIKKGR